jgi:hypothetical protein
LGTKQLISAETGVFGEVEVLFDLFWKGEELGRRGEDVLYNGRGEAVASQLEEAS